MNKNQVTESLENGLIWLSASDPEVLKNKCPRWEKIKYEAFGASVLVPVFFGMIASSYAVSTLTSNWFIIIMFALVWGFIILTIDRVLLSTYRAFVSKSKKWIQFVLRITVAVLMGLTVSHPLTLLLFKDTINSEIEKERTNEMLAMRQKTEGEKKALEDRIRVVSDELAAHQKKYQETVSGDFLFEAPKEPARTAPVATGQFDDIDRQIREYKLEKEEIRGDLEQWQMVYDEEVRGIRSGRAGIGPNARAIERDHLVWRRDEIKRLNGVISDLSAKRSKLSSDLMTRSMEMNAQLEANRRDLEKQKMAVFASQQGQLLEVIKGQIDSTTAELAMLRKEAGQLSTDTSDRVAHLKEEKRSDLMAQTHTLHKIFKDPAGGGTFALAVYIVLVGLFTLIDTIPLVVKFCAVPGLYDKHLYYKENSVRAIGENEAIDDKFEEAMKKRDLILHGLLNYDPDKVAVMAQPQLIAAQHIEVDAETEDTVPVVEAPREITGKIDTRAVAVEKPKVNGYHSEAEREIEVELKSEVSPIVERINDIPETPVVQGRIEFPEVEEPIDFEDDEFVVETPDLPEIGIVNFNESTKPQVKAPKVEEKIEEPAQDLAEVYKDEPEMLQPGFGATLLNEGDSETADFSAEIEIPLSKNGSKEKPKSNFKSVRRAQRAAGGLALQPSNLSEKAR